MNAQFTKHGSEGFTLVELLVTILIIVILAVAMLPLLKPFVTKAQYSADAIPVIGNIRTKVELFRVEKDYTPGIPVDDQGYKQGNNSDILNLDSLADNSGNQYMIATTNNSGQMEEKFYCGGEDMSGKIYESSHVWKRIDIGMSDLTGVRLRPNHMQYVVVNSDGDSYYWGIACFGDGNGLAKGCGYAVLEYNNPTNRKFVATYEVWKPQGNGTLELSVDNTLNGTKKDMLQGNKVYIPTLSLLESDIPGTLGKMRNLGWEVQ